ncbi:MAG: dihydrodipicolinate synthase family protein [Rhodospirillales bacterium 70-18]|nr:MAG: dihydrodipicolinate synthase family protein [Rhodospirillales bacterium 70-18]
MWPILYAFFTAQNTLDRAAMRRQTEICVAGGSHGLAVMGLATEVAKLSPAERRQVVEWTAEDLAGRLPLAVTIFGATPAEQSEAVAHAAANGAAWVILQPPRQPGISEDELLAFFGTVIERSPVPAGIQNAPELIGIGLSPGGIAELARRHANFRVLKGEAPTTLIARVVEETGGKLAVFNGRGGLELPDNLRAGCAGLIPAPDCFEAQVAIYEAMRRGDEAEAERLYREILPAIVFVMQSVDHLICYGKRLVAARMGIAVHDRAPGLLPNAFGEAAVGRFARALGPYPA